MAHVAKCGLVWIGSWCGAAIGVVGQFRFVGFVHFSLVTLINFLRTPNKSGLWPEVDGWLGLAQSST